MIHETNSIRLRAGKRLFLLLKSEDTYYRIDCNLLSREQETRLFLQFPCSEQELKAMNVTFSVLKVKRIRRILAEGCCRGNLIELHIGLNRLRYSLVNDIKPDVFEAFFSGIHIDFSLQASPPELPASTIRKVSFHLPDFLSSSVFFPCF